MNPDVTIQTPTAMIDDAKHIEWGGLIKGAAVLAGIAVVAGIGFLAFSAAAGVIVPAVTGNAALSSLAGGVMQAATVGAGWLGAGLNTLVGVASGIPGLVVNTLGIGNVALATGGTEAVAHGVGLAGAATAAAVATHAALPAMHHAAPTHLVDMTATAPDTTDHTLAPSIFAAQNGGHAVGTASMHDMAHAAHSGIELNESHHKNGASWMDRFASKSGFASHADAVMARADTKPTIQPRNDQFAEQLNADRAQLDLVLER